MKYSTNISFSGHEVNIDRARFGIFILAETEVDKYLDGLKRMDSGASIGAIQSYLRLTMGDECPDITQSDWVDVITAFIKLKELNSIQSDIPLITFTNSEGQPPPWDYLGRSWIIWVHLIATAYGWPREDIFNLWPEEAAQFVQEILIDEQLDKEWIHSLSEVAYSHSKTGKATYNRLKRPKWMYRSTGPRKTKILRSSLPQGVVKNLSGLDEYGNK